MKKVLKWIGIVIGGLIALLVIVGVGLSFSTRARLNKTYDIQPEKLAIPTDQASIAEGERLVSIYCQGCHGDDLGGTDFFNDPALAVVDAPNLTSGNGGVGSYYSDADWVRSIRHGVDPKGRALFIMPAGDFYHFSDEDLGQIIAYLETVSPVDHDSSDFSVGPLGHVLVGAGVMGDVFNAETIDHNAPRPQTPETTVSAAYGAYLVDTFGCRTCHGPDLRGGKDPDPAAPPVPGLAPGGKLDSWTEDDFIKQVRIRKSEWMPFESLAKMNDDELSAIWLYLQSLPVAVE